jgi:hypothetical protein
MRDLDRLSFGMLGTLGTIALEDAAKLASVAAGTATAVFMLVSVVEKVRSMFKK